MDGTERDSTSTFQHCVVCAEADDSVGDRQSCDNCERWFCTSDKCAKIMLGSKFDRYLQSGDIECMQCKAASKAARKAAHIEAPQLVTADPVDISPALDM